MFLSIFDGSTVGKPEFLWYNFSGNYINGVFILPTEAENWKILS